MTEPRGLDFSAEAEDAETITFPDGKTTCELPTMDQMDLPTWHWVASHGEEWQSMFDRGLGDLSAAERKRFNHLNNHLVYALCSDVPKATVDTLGVKEKSQVIVRFMTASPAFLNAIVQAAQSAIAGKPKPNRKRKTTAR